MLEWMHDINVVNDLHVDFLKKTLNDAQKFILESSNSDENVHFAIVSDEDEYMGTVSLKCIDREAKTAEFAITVRKKAMGQGYSWYAMKKILSFGFEQIGVSEIYWCVSANNTRAVKFYRKHMFMECIDVPKVVLKRYEGMENLIWFSIAAQNIIEPINTSEKHKNE